MTINKKIRIGFIGFVVFLFLVSFAFGEKGPRIKFAEKSHNFGKIKQGKILTHIFVFKNEGDVPLNINKVSSSCGCAAVLVSKKKVDPGEKGELKVTFNTRGYAGKVTKYIYVESNDSVQKKKQLDITAEIDVPPQPKISLSQYSSDVGLVLEGEQIKDKIRIINKGELELKVNCSKKGVTFFLKGKEISFPLKIPKGKSVEVEVNISPRKRKGPIREYVLINSNDPNRRALSFFFSGYIITKEQLKELFAKYRDKLN